MKGTSLVLFATALSVAINLGPTTSLYAAQGGTGMSELGNPPPGTVSDQESTEKKRNPSRDQSAEQNAQITMGGAKSSVQGKIQKIEGQYYYLKDEETGDQVRVQLNQDTNLDCGASGGQMTSDRQTPAGEGTKQQRDQGQRKDETAMGSGFKIGDCAFNTGDKVKAEVSDMGTVTTLKLVTRQGSESNFEPRKFGGSAQTGELANVPGNQENMGQLDMTAGGGGLYGQYVVLPVPYGQLKDKGVEGQLPVKNPEGKTLGSIQRLIMDTKTGQIEYAVIRLAESHNLIPVPWADLKMQRDKEKGFLTFNTAQHQLEPQMTARDAQDRSPEISQIINDMQKPVAPPDLRSGTDPIKERSASGKAPKEDKKGEVVRGRVASVDGPYLTIKDRSGKETRLHIDQNTEKGSMDMKEGNFRVGDAVEAYVGPKGHAMSISAVRLQSGMPDDGLPQ